MMDIYLFNPVSSKHEASTVFSREEKAKMHDVSAIPNEVNLDPETISVS